MILLEHLQILLCIPVLLSEKKYIYQHHMREALHLIYVHEMRI